MKRILLVLSVFAIFVCWKIKTNDAVTFKLTNIECLSYNPSWFVIHKCRLKIMARNRVGFYFNGTVLHPANDISLHLQMFKRANGYKPWLLKSKVDVCRFLRKAYDPFAKLVGNLFLEFTNFNHTCPYIGPQLVEGFYLRPELLKLPLPTGDYKLALRWHFDNKLQFDTNASFTFVENLMDQ